MRLLKLAALVAALMLALAACGGNGEDEVDDDDVPAVEDDRPEELDDDVAAVVNGEEIPASLIEDQAEALSANPQIAEALEGDDAELTMAVMRAQILTTLIINVVALEAAEDLGVPVTDEDVERARTELEADTGGAEGLQEALERDSMSEQHLAGQLEALAAVRNVQEALAEDADDTDEEADEGREDEDPEATEDRDGTDPDAPDADQQRAQQHIAERLLAADVVVNADYGEWDPERGQVVPAGMPEATRTPPQDPEDLPES